MQTRNMSRCRSAQIGDARSGVVLVEVLQLQQKYSQFNARVRAYTRYTLDLDLGIPRMDLVDRLGISYFRQSISMPGAWRVGGQKAATRVHVAS